MVGRPLERWQSGRMHSLGKRADCQRSREFESPPLRFPGPHDQRFPLSLFRIGEHRVEIVVPYTIATIIDIVSMIVAPFFFVLCRRYAEPRFQGICTVASINMFCLPFFGITEIARRSLPQPLRSTLDLAWVLLVLAGPASILWFAFRYRPEQTSNETLEKVSAGDNQ
jgi:hypothetical protein